MRDLSENGEAQIETVGPLAPTKDPNNADQLDAAGRSILRLLHKAVAAVEENNRRALDAARTLSQQLRATEDRIAELEAELQTYRGQSERAEQWLHKVYTEIEDRFLRQKR
jgi:predicted  nucleic acid-binding Zn-ribbon protein